MGVIDRVRGWMRRDYAEVGGWKALQSLMLDGLESSAGVPVTDQSSLTFAPVWAAVRLISNDIASTPCPYYKRVTGPNGEDLGKTRYREHPNYRLLNLTANAEMSSRTARQTMQMHASLTGNGYAEIQRNGEGKPVGYFVLTPDRVKPERQNGRLVYRVTQPSGAPAVTIEPANMLHIKGPSWSGDEGLSTIAFARESIGLGLAAERFGGTFFGNGATFGGILSHPAAWKQEARDSFRKAIQARHASVENAHRFLLLPDDVKHAALHIPPDDAQFLQTRQFQIADVARWFGVPAHMIGDLSRSTNNNIEQQSLEYYATTLRAWLDVWEAEINLKLVSPLERNLQFAEFLMEDVLKADTGARGAFYQALSEIGAITVNEIRTRENLNPIAGGDQVFVRLDRIPADKVDEYYEAIIEAKKAPEPAPVQRPVDQSGDEALRGVLETLSKRVEGEMAATRETFAAEVEAARAATVAAEQRVSTLSESLSASDATIAEARQALEAERAKVAALESQAANLTAWRASMLVALRESMVDSVRRVTSHEVDRARRRCATSEDLRRWVASFYDEHRVAVVADIIRPAVAAHLVWRQSDEDAVRVSRSIAQAYCDESVRQLSSVAEERDGDVFAGELAGLLVRWEQGRPDAVAGKVLVDDIAAA